MKIHSKLPMTDHVNN